MKQAIAILGTFLLTLGTQGADIFAASATLRSTCAQLIQSKDQIPEAQRLHRLFDAHWQYSLSEFPEEATWVGEPGRDDRWADYSADSVKRRKEDLEFPWKVLQSIDRRLLNEDDQLNFDLFQRNIRIALESRKFPSEFLPLSQMHGIQREAASMFAMMKSKTPKDFANILARLEGLAPLIDQTIALMEEGIAQGIVPSRAPLRDIASQVQAQITSEPLDSPLLRSFTSLPSSMTDQEKKQLQEEAIVRYEQYARPAFEKLEAFLTDTYLPACRSTTGVSNLPNGQAWYAFEAKRSTTTDMTPRQIHEIGLKEVARIRAEMEKIKADTGFEGTLLEFFEFLRTDPQFYYERPTQLIAGYRDICKRVDPKLFEIFGTLPRQPYGIKPVPTYIEKSVTTAYYQPGSSTAGRPGYFFANTYDLASRPKWEMVALSLHEAVPGHHLQIAIADELENVPEFRRYGHYTAFVEGWGLYSESLGEEMGMYEDPYDKFGQLTYEMWRAIRLVVDTGMHSFGWSREKAIDFFKENAGKAEHDIVVEIDRYIVWPGQALAYKIGELKIKELRAMAEKELGDAFDIRQFHDEVLGAGAIPLDILETRIKAWVKAQKGE